MSTIHINPANKGKFTETKKRTGKSTAQYNSLKKLGYTSNNSAANIMNNLYGNIQNKYIEGYDQEIKVSDDALKHKFYFTDVPSDNPDYIPILNKDYHTSNLYSNEAGFPYFTDRPTIKQLSHNYNIDFSHLIKKSSLLK